MKSIDAYLMFDGNCREAITFYSKALGAEPFIQTFGDAHQGRSETEKNRIMHSRINKGSATLMASDIMEGGMPGAPPFQRGSDFQISLSTDSVEETDKIFKALSEKGSVTLPLQDMFWGAYFGMLTDRFGVRWMLNYDKPKP